MSELLNLSKDEALDLGKIGDEGLQNAVIELGWTENHSADEADFDVDVSLFGCINGKINQSERTENSAGKFTGFQSMAWYGRAEPAGLEVSACNGAVIHTGDILDGGDVERIKIDFSKIDVEKYPELYVIVSIHDAETRKQDFGRISGTYLDILDDNSGEKKAHYSLSEDNATQTAMIAAKFYHENGGWHFVGLERAVPGGLSAVLAEFGLSAG